MYKSIPEIDMRMTMPSQTSGYFSQYPRRLSPYELLTRHRTQRGRLQARRSPATSLPSTRWRGKHSRDNSLLWIGLALILTGSLCFVCNITALVHNTRRSEYYEDNWPVQMGFGIWNFVASATAGGVAIACGRSPGRRTLLASLGVFVLASCLSACGIALAAVSVHIEIMNKTDRRNPAKKFEPNILVLACLMIVSHAMTFACTLFGTRQSVLRLQRDHVPRRTAVHYISPPPIPINIHTPWEYSDMWDYNGRRTASRTEQISETKTPYVHSACNESEILENPPRMVMDMLEPETLSQTNAIPDPMARTVMFECRGLDARITTQNLSHDQYAHSPHRTVLIVNQHKAQTNHSVVMGTISYLSLILFALIFKILSVVKYRGKKSHHVRYRLLNDS